MSPKGTVAPELAQLEDVHLPYWLQRERRRCEEIREQRAGSDEKHLTRTLRMHNQRLQLHTYSWNLMTRMLGASTQEAKTLEESFFKFLEKAPEPNDEIKAQDILYKSGPVGDLPLHQAFLLGLTELGKKLIIKFYTRRQLDGEYEDQFDKKKFRPKHYAGINTPYVSDLDAWKPIVQNLFDDGGLYTGETVLHIAIVQQDIHLVKWMLEQGASITSRAKGAFFKPHRSYTEQDLQGVNMSALGGSLALEPFENKDSVCDYGEFPFSFAASVGNCEILALLAKHAERGGITKEELIEVLKTQRKIRSNLGIESEIVVTEKGGFMRLLVGLQDSRGNTALHMAVRYNQQACVDWIMSHSGQDSLHMLNADGITPFTLAA